MKTFTSTEVCKICGKPNLYIRNLQKALDLPIFEQSAKYPSSYVSFLQRIIALRTFNISLDDIADLFHKEKNLLRLLKIDNLGESDIWYLDQCGKNNQANCRLMLTGYNVGFPLTENAIQSNLDFGNNKVELFNSDEMGEDVARALDSYKQMTARFKARIKNEKPLLQYALKWARNYG